ncbi:DUF3311 domain-containing protein [Geobacillus sp. FSL W8-0032]|uniref:Membrane protein YhjC n=2 Tax=Geobacillus TaxID=129337 RepID=A0A679FP68_9BACL|nr:MULTISPECIES: DUF3311 domain-containing protein [Geobacillus]KYD25862.1 hypothetical protein B4113_1533 [Geobacillus sp. B4113_201601]MEB3750884.1 hypothetical protein [Geobacillus icigianus]BBW97800.1 putative membrane protein YhjC [Geobacillus subterraneus]
MKSIRWLMVLPFVGMLGGIPFVNKVEPYVFGMPLLLFWLVAWVIATSVIMAIVYRFDPAVKEDEQT